MWLSLISGQTVSRGYDRVMGLAFWLLAFGFYAERTTVIFAGGIHNYERNELS